MKREFFLLIASLLLFLTVGAQGAEKTSPESKGRASDRSYIRACITKVDVGLGKDSFCAFVDDMRRDCALILTDYARYDTLDQALSELQVILLREKITSREKVLIGRECERVGLDRSSPPPKEFNILERAKIDSFLEGQFFEAALVESASDQKKTKPVRIVTKFVQVGGGTEGLSFDWVESPFSP